MLARSTMLLSLVGLLVTVAVLAVPETSRARAALPSASVASATFTAVADTYLDEADPTANYGSSRSLLVGRTDARVPTESRTLVQFDLSGIPAGAILDRAELRLYQLNAGAAASYTISVDEVGTGWVESTVNWNSQPAATYWGDPSAVLDQTTGYKSWDVRQIVGRWLSRLTPNNGFLLRGDGRTAGTREFASRELAGQEPALLVEYHLTPTATATATRTSTATATSSPAATATATPTPSATATARATATLTPTATSTPVDTTPPTNPTVTANRPINTWSNLPTILMSWTGASDGRGSGVHGYSFQWSTSLDALPDTVEDTTGSSVLTNIPADGLSWYFLVRTVDNAGNWVPAASGSGPYPLDTIPPDNPTLTTIPAPGAWSNDNTISAAWTTATDNPGGSGVAGYSTLFSQSVKDRPDDIVDTTWNTDGSGVVADGQWYFHLITADNVGNWTPLKAMVGPIKIDATPPTSHAGKGEHEVIQSSVYIFPVRIAGADNASGVKSITVRYQDVTTKGPWTQWKSDAQPDGEYTFFGKSGHLYCFQTQAIDNAGNVESWPAQADSCVAAATADIVAEKLVLTQGIQNYDGGAVLIAGRRTFARCYVKSESGDYDGVSARLVVRDNQGVQLGLLKPLNTGGTITVKSSPNRGSFNDSFFFEIPVGWVTVAGNSYFCNVNTPDKYWEKTRANNSASLTTNALQAPPALKLRLVDLPYRYLGQVRKPRWDDAWLLESYLKRIYPITQLKVDYGYLDPAYNSMPSTDTALDDLTAVWVYDLFFHGGDPNLYWYGMIANDAGNVGGLAWRPGRVGVGSTGPQWRGCSISDGPWDLDDSCGDHVAAHELGHSFGRRHVKCTGTEAKTDSNYPFLGGKISAATSWSDPTTWYGFDAEDNRIMGPTWTDIMGYCQNQWISDYTYFAIYNALRATGQSAAVAAALAEPRAEQLWVSASVSPDDVVTLRPFKRIPDAASILPGGAGEYAIRLSGAGGSVLADYPVDVLFDDPDEPGVLAATVPWVDGTQQVAIIHGGTLLASRPVSAHPPSVTLVSPNGGESLEGASVTVRWNGTDPDGDALTCDIEYSTDGGAHWQLLGTRLTGSEATLSLERLPGSQQARFRVWTTDGVNSATDASDGNFAVPAKSPVAGILAPHPGLRTTFGQLITFDGSAVDPEDGSLPDGSLAWSSNLVGSLGAGSLLQTSELITGTHRITLTAVDSQGLTGSATITVQVGLEASYLPLVLR